MIATQTKHSSHPFPRAKIVRIIEDILANGKKFELRTADSGIREMKVVRIVTSAWKDLRPPERISKVLDAVEGKLSEAERDRILRFSVLTPQEYKRVVLDSPVDSSRREFAAFPAKKLTARRKITRKAKRLHQ